MRTLKLRVRPGFIPLVKYEISAAMRHLDVARGSDSEVNSRHTRVKRSRLSHRAFAAAEALIDIGKQALAHHRIVEPARHRFQLRYVS